MQKESKNLDFTVVFLPDGRPCPGVMTAEETVQFLRLDSGDPMRTLKYFRDEGKLCGFRLGRKVRYRLDDVLEFVAKKSREKQDN
jgi:hypothetical protein